MERCMFCGQITEMIWVHGHYQCSRCHQVTVPCCNGEIAGDSGNPGRLRKQHATAVAKRYSESG